MNNDKFETILEVTEEKILEDRITKTLLCSNCFNDHGLKLEAARIGEAQDSVCPNCHSTEGKKLNKDLITWLAQVYFIRGSVQRRRYGAAPTIALNEHQFKKGGLSRIPNNLTNDIKLIEDSIEIGFFDYGPRLWMIGHVEPLKALQKKAEREFIIEKILKKYPSFILNKNEIIYRLRVNPQDPSNQYEFDSPPINLTRKHGRLDSQDLSIMYCSQDIEGCVHECRVTVEDDLYLATLCPARPLKLLDLTTIIDEKCTEFESVDIAIHMLFFAGEHSYKISRSIAIAACKAGYDGLLYPSYFSQVRSGAMPFDTIYGISIRRYPQFKDLARDQIIPNIALFGQPLHDNNVFVKCLNRIILNTVHYEIRFGPVRNSDKI